jgi:hypothetical protein
MSEQVPATRTAPRRRRQRAHAKQHADNPAAPAAPKAPSRLDQLEDALTCPNGANIAEMMAATGWQQHSVREAMAREFKTRGLIVTSEKVDGVRRYGTEKHA